MTSFRQTVQRLDPAVLDAQPSARLLGRIAVVSEDAAELIVCTEGDINLFIGALLNCTAHIASELCPDRNFIVNSEVLNSNKRVRADVACFQVNTDRQRTRALVTFENKLKSVADKHIGVLEALADTSSGFLVKYGELRESNKGAASIVGKVNLSLNLSFS
jgi:hypothetical protein